MPTILNLADVAVPQVDGISLVELMRGRQHGLSLEAYSESLYPERFGCSPLRAVRDGRFKLIDAPRPELYDLQHDPLEERNIYDERRAMGEAMTARARAIAKARASVRVQDGRNFATTELHANLAALGYVGSMATREFARTGLQAGLPDPKDCIGKHARR